MIPRLGDQILGDQITIVPNMTPGVLVLRFDSTDDGSMTGYVRLPILAWQMTVYATNGQVQVDPICPDQVGDYDVWIYELTPTPTGLDPDLMIRWISPLDDQFSDWSMVLTWATQCLVDARDQINRLPRLSHLHPRQVDSPCS